MSLEPQGNHFGVVGIEGGVDFEAFVVARTPALLRYAHLLTGDAGLAEDLVQSALAGAYRHWSRASASPDAYVRRSILNGYLKQWRMGRRSRESSYEVPEVSQPDPSWLVDERDALWRLLARLPRRQRAVLVLRFFEDLTEAQTAEVLGVSTGTVKSQSAMALTTLRASRALEPETRS